ncbi:hypothetical protein [Marinicella rhabdoformis]|uniref:hypothetical protein n=1 Tax=Marinicella rhabdoformis TaxID=2580566 RepID=UPI0012AEBADD|nr:hypothetical protein [Marinicella rhabdoformis]
MIKKRQIILPVLAVLLLSACGGGPQLKPLSPKAALIQALVAKDNAAITQHKSILNNKRKTLNVVQLYQLAIEEKPYRLVSNSKLLLKNIHHYSLQQQIILKQMLLWAYAHPIYRQETGKQVRILQRAELLVAPSDINFNKCQSENLTDIKGCSALRQLVNHIISTHEMNETLNTMAGNDPCINLTQENIAGDAANLCLASRKGDLKINLLSVPNFLSDQWEQAIDS